jgi:exopolysaccharide biosynthesis WecB/TagA/CpsF family protein
MKVVFYMHDLSGGGVERMRLALIGELRSRGLQVSLALGRNSGPLAALLPPDLCVTELGSSRMLGAIWPLAALLRRTTPDVIVASLDHNNITAILARLLARARTRVVICQHNALSAETRTGWRYRAIPWLYWLLQSHAHGIVAVSTGVANDLATTAGIPRARITPIYNPVIGPDFAARAGAGAPHPWLADGGAPIFLFAGRLTRQKDPGTALDALALVLRRTAARLVVLGDGELLPALQAQALRLGIAEHVAFVGFQPNPLPWMRHAAALVSTSRYEGLGNAIIEALACGTPVIATDCPYGPSEILLAGEVGRLVAVGDAPALAAAMQAQIAAPRQTEKLASRARTFTAAACADAHQDLFAGLLTGAQGVTVFGMRLSSLNAENVVGLILGQPATKGVRLVVTPNLDHVRLLLREAFAAAYRAADIVCPDGWPVLLYARWHGFALPAPVTGCALFHHLAHHPGLAAQPVFVVVESAATARAVAAWAVRRSLPNIRVLAAPLGLEGDAQAQQRLAVAIREAAPAILVMTLGAPLSETFVHRHRDILPPCWALCVGQAVRVELGLTRRAPRRWQDLGLEWLWRLRQEPWRLAGRYARAASWFPVAVWLDLRLRRGAARGRRAA